MSESTTPPGAVPDAAPTAGVDPALAETLVPRRRPRSVAFHVVAAVVPAAAVFLAGEAVVRWRYDIVAPRPFHWPGIIEEADLPLRWRLQASYEGVYHQQTERLRTTTNALGMRDPPFTEARRTAPVRVLFLGDSVTFGRGVEDGAPFPAQLEARWSARLGGGVACFNAAVEGYDTVQELEALRERGPVIQPTAVVVGWYRNDVAVPSDAVKERVIHGQFARDEEEYRDWKRRYVDNQASLLDRSALLRLARLWWKDRRTRAGLDERAEGLDEDHPSERGVERSKAALLAMRDWCRARGVPFALVLFPAREEVEANAPVHGPVSRVFAAFAAEHGIPCVDLFEPWSAWCAANRGRTLYLPRDRCHPNAPGHAQVAAWLDDALLPLVRPPG